MKYNLTETAAYKIAGSSIPGKVWDLVGDLATMHCVDLNTVCGADTKFNVFEFGEKRTKSVIRVTKFGAFMVPKGYLV